MNSFDTRLLDNWYKKIHIKKEERFKIERFNFGYACKKDQE